VLLDLALSFVLRVGIEFVAGDDLGRDRRLVLAQFGRHQRGKFFFCQIAAHGFSPWCDSRMFPGSGVGSLILLLRQVSHSVVSSREGVSTVQCNLLSKALPRC
jgi:hypothetical protein